MQENINIPEKKDVRVEIKNYLANRGMSKRWLAAQLGVNDVYISDLLLIKKKIKPEFLDQINEVLDTNFTLEQVPPVE